MPQALIGPGRRVAGDAHALVRAKAGFFKKPKKAAEPVDTDGRLAMADQVGDAMFLIALHSDRKRDDDAIGR